MSFFGKKNTNIEEQNSRCCCSETDGCCTSANTSEEFLQNSIGMGVSKIAVLGSGCKSCHALYENVKAAVAELGLSVDVEYITDLERIMSYGAMSMPALVINDKVATMGKVQKTKEIITFLKG